MADKSVMIEIRGDLKDINVKLASLGKRFHSSAARGSKAFDAVNRSVRRIKSTLTSVGVIAAGVFAIRGIKNLSGAFLETAKATEGYQTRLEVLLGSQKEGNRLFKEMADYAGRVPFEYQEIMGAATRLAGVMDGGVAQIVEWMPLIGDLAAATGLGIEQTTEQISRMYSAGAASADLFRDRGVLAMLGFKAGVSYTADETRAKLLSVWKDPESRFRGATEKMAKDWTGLTSMMADKWQIFRQKVMDSSVFSTLKDGLKQFVDKLEEFRKNGVLEDWARNTAVAVVESMRIATKAVGQVLISINQANVGIEKSRSWFYEKGVEVEKIASAELEKKIKAVEAGGLEAAPWIERVTNDWKTAEDAIKAYRRELDASMVQTQRLQGRQAEALGDLADSIENLNTVDNVFDKLNSYLEKASSAAKEGITPKVNTQEAYTGWKNFYGDWRYYKDGIESDPIVPEVKTAVFEERIVKIKNEWKATTRWFEENPAQVVVEAKTKSSPLRDFSEGIDYMKSRLEELDATVNQVFDFTNFSGLIETYMSLFREARISGVDSSTGRVLASQAIGREASEMAGLLKQILNTLVFQYKQSASNTYNINAGGSARDVAFEIQRLQQAGMAPGLG